MRRMCQHTHTRTHRKLGGELSILDVVCLYAHFGVETLRSMNSTGTNYTRMRIRWEIVEITYVIEITRTFIMQLHSY